MHWASRKQREFKDNVFIFDDEEEELEGDDQNDEESEDSEDEEESKCEEESEGHSNEHHLLSLCENLLDKIDKIRKDKYFTYFTLKVSLYIAY